MNSWFLFATTKRAFKTVDLFEPLYKLVKSRGTGMQIQQLFVIIIFYSYMLVDGWELQWFGGYMHNVRATAASLQTLLLSKTCVSDGFIHITIPLVSFEH